MTCSVCNQAYDGIQPFVSCEGPCARCFHIDCVKVSKSNHKLVTTNKQYKWFCKDCSNSTLMSVLKEIHSLSSEVKRLSSLIDKPPPAANVDSPTPMDEELPPPAQNVIDLVNEDISVPSQKRARSISTSQIDDITNVESLNFPKKSKNSSKASKAKNLRKINDTPQASTSQSSTNDIHHGRPQITAQQLSAALESTNNEPLIAPLSAVEANKWIFISRLDPQTSEIQVVHHLTTNLQISASDIVCNKLIKKGISEDRISFTSFKIGLKSNLFDKVNNKTFWPTGAVVHEFKPRSKNWPRLPVIPRQSEGRQY